MLVGWGYVVSKLNKFKRLKIKEVVSYWIWEMNDEEVWSWGYWIDFVFLNFWLSKVMFYVYG